MVVDADLKSAHALNGFYMLFSRRHGPGPAEALVRRETMIVMRYAEQLAI
jgi:hypothetical protein